MCVLHGHGEVWRAGHHETDLQDEEVYPGERERERERERETLGGEGCLYRGRIEGVS